jgi:hypothetical protein
MITMGLSPSNFLFGSSRSYHCNCHHIWHETTVQFLWVYTIICSSLGQVHIPCYWNFASRKGCACPVPYGDTTWHLRRMSKPNHEKQYSLDFCCALGPSLVTPTNLIEDTRQQILWWKCDVGTPWARGDSWENDRMSRVGESMACLAWGMSRRRCARNLFFSNSISISIFFYFQSIHFIPLQSTALHCAPTALVSPLCLLH